MERAFCPWLQPLRFPKAPTLASHGLVPAWAVTLCLPWSILRVGGWPGAPWGSRWVRAGGPELLGGLGG